MKLGDLVEPAKESTFILRFLSKKYLDAIVVSLKPFVLVSWDRTMIWQDAKKKNFIKKRVAPTEIYTKCLNKFKQFHEKKTNNI